MKKLLLGLFLTSSLFSGAQVNCWSIGDGSDGAFHATADMALVGGTYNYTSFTIDAGVTVNVTGTSALVVKCTDTVSIAGVLEANGANGTDGVTFASAGVGAVGVAGGGNGGDGSFHPSNPGVSGLDGGNTGGGFAGVNWESGGGAGYASVGGASGVTNGGVVYGTPGLAVLEAGSGGGGGSGGNNCGSGGGGAGGGVIVINAQTILIALTGVISSNGGNGGTDGGGSCGGGGAGSGGALWIAAPIITNEGIISAAGGTGGTGYSIIGGSGSEGRIRIDGIVTGAGSANPTAFVGPVIPEGSQTLTICNGDSVVVGSVAHNTTGIYMDLLTNGNGCDSIVTTDLTVSAPIMNTITLTASTLSSDEIGASYQWLDCDNGNSPIAGATSQDYTPASVGNYAVDVTVNGCTVTSSCFAYNVTSIKENKGVTIELYPTPTKGIVTVSFETIVSIETLKITDITGRIILSNQDVKTNELTLDLSNESNGVYYLQIQVNGSIQSLKILKN